MTFESLAHSAKNLGDALYASTGRKLVDEVSLGIPDDDRSEVSFIKSVLWGYVLWFEACQPAGRYLMNIVRNSSPEDHSAASRAFRDVQNLRTFHAHNLRPSSERDQYQLNQARAWLAQNGGDERSWDRCTTKLCSALSNALDILCAHWMRVTASPEDARTAIQALIYSLEREWDPHLFDRIIEDIATSLGLSDFDPVKYRGERLQDWRKTTEFFLDRTSAEVALRRVIHQEMSIKFGPPA